MTYSEASLFLEQLNIRGIKPGLESIKELAALVGNPQDKLKFIHVAGTNGKGSVSTYIAAILKEAGLTVGSYQTPAVFEDTEIIRINGKNISKATWAREIEYMASELEKNPEVSPTRFEFETVLAMRLFASRNCDMVVLECGMGGLLDATNFIDSTEVCVFTPIGMDHMGFLGDTLEKIATNKAGIIKDGAKVVSAYQEDCVVSVIDDICRNNKTECCYVNLNNTESAKKKNLSKVKMTLSGSSFDYKNFKDIKINPLGFNQIENACLAIEAVDKLSEIGYDIPEKAVKKGLSGVYMPGRFEVISKSPMIILDGGHNVPAAVRLKENIEKYLAGRKIIYILSMLKDKEYDKVVHMMCTKADHIITATSPNRARALEAVELANCVFEVNSMVSAADSIDEAVELALLMADKQTAIVVWGSLSHLKEVRKCVENRRNIKSDTHGIEEF